MPNAWIGQFPAVRLSIVTTTDGLRETSRENSQVQSLEEGHAGTGRELHRGSIGRKRGDDTRAKRFQKELPGPCSQP